MGLLDVLKNPSVQRGAVGAGSTLLANRIVGGGGGVGKTALQQALEAQKRSIAMGGDIATGLQPHATSLIDLASRSLDPAAAYYSSIMSGDRNAAFKSLAPEVGRISDSYKAAGDASANLMPRGGGRSDFFADQPYQQQRDVTNLLQTARPKAAEGLLQTGTAASNAGNNTFSTLENALSAGRAGGDNLLNYDIQDKAAQYDKGRDVGKALFDILQNPDMKGILSGSGSTLGGGTSLAGSAAAGPTASGTTGAIAGLAPKVAPMAVGPVGGAGASTAAAGGTALLSGAGGGSIAGGAAIGLPGGLLAPAAPGAAVGATGAGAGTAAGGSGASSALTGLLTNPVTAVVAGGIIAAIAWAKSQAHHEASSWVSGFQNPFDQKVDAINRQFYQLAQSGQLDRSSATAMRQGIQDLFKTYDAERQKFAAKGSDEARVAQQSKATQDQAYAGMLSGMDRTIAGLA